MEEKVRKEEEERKAKIEAEKKAAEEKVRKEASKARKIARKEEERKAKKERNKEKKAAEEAKIEAEEAKIKAEEAAKAAEEEAKKEKKAIAKKVKKQGKKKTKETEKARIEAEKKAAEKKDQKEKLPKEEDIRTENVQKTTALDIKDKLPSIPDQKNLPVQEQQESLVERELKMKHATAIYKETCDKLKDANLPDAVRKTILRKNVEHLKVAARYGNAELQNYLGYFYLIGAEGVEKNLIEAEKFLKLSAEQGDPMAQLTLGSEYAEGKNFGKNVKEGMRLLELSANNGSSNAQIKLGQYYLADPDKSRHFFQMAADNKKDPDRQAIAKDFLKMITPPSTKPLHPTHGQLQQNNKLVGIRVKFEK